MIIPAPEAGTLDQTRFILQIVLLELPYFHHNGSVPIQKASLHNLGTHSFTSCQMLMRFTCGFEPLGRTLQVGIAGFAPATAGSTGQSHS